MTTPAREDLALIDELELQYRLFRAACRKASQMANTKPLQEACKEALGDAEEEIRSEFADAWSGTFGYARTLIEDIRDDEEDGGERVVSLRQAREDRAAYHRGVS